MERRAQPSVRVAEEVAEHDGVEPMDLDPPLYEVLDPDSLDALFCGSGERTDSPVTVRFTYNEYTVIVESPDRVTVENPEPGRKSRARSPDPVSTD